MNDWKSDNTINHDRGAYIETSRMLRRLKRKMFLDAVQGSHKSETGTNLRTDDGDSISVSSNVSSSLMGENSSSSIEHE